jgi:hypothetical protein
MAITTYAELQSSIANWLNRDDLTAVIPDFISLSEAEMDRKIRHWRMEKRVTTTADGQYTGLVGDYLEAIRFSVPGSRYERLELASQGEIQQRRYSTNNTTGIPQYYAITDSQLELYPTPDGSYTVEMLYYGQIPPLTDSTTTNWLLTHHPDAYLYGALVHAAPYLGDDQRAMTWSALYQSALDAINKESSDAKFGGSGRRLKIASY